jgi:DNA-directed RNA polymerase alpha subunit
MSPEKTIDIERLRARVVALVTELPRLRAQVVDLATDLRDALRIALSQLDSALSLDVDSSPRVDELDLSFRAYNCLDFHPIKTIAELVNTPCSELLKIKNMGIVTVAEIQALLEQRGLTLRDLPHAARFDKYLRRERERVAKAK